MYCPPICPICDEPMKDHCTWEPNPIWYCDCLDQKWEEEQTQKTREQIKPNPSEVFSAYNKIRTKYRDFPNLIDPGRLNKALGILQSYALEGKLDEYVTQADHCYCKDFEFKNASRRKNSEGTRYTGPCKHQLVVIMLARIEETRNQIDAELDQQEYDNYLVNQFEEMAANSFTTCGHW